MKVILDIDLISEELYQMLLKEYKHLYGDYTFDKWEISVNCEDLVECNCLAPFMEKNSRVCGNCGNILY